MCLGQLFVYLVHEGRRAEAEEGHNERAGSVVINIYHQELGYLQEFPSRNFLLRPRTTVLCFWKVSLLFLFLVNSKQANKDAIEAFQLGGGSTSTRRVSQIKDEAVEEPATQ